MTTKLYCDGNYYPLAACAGIGVVIVSGGSLRKHRQRVNEDSNGRAELQAAIIGLSLLVVPTTLTVISDYAALADTMNGIARARVNLDLWHALEWRAEGHRITWKWRPKTPQNRWLYVAHLEADLAVRGVA